MTDTVIVTRNVTSTVVSRPRANNVAVNAVGVQGPPGSTRIPMLAQDSLAPGQPVFADQVNGRARLATAAVWTQARVIGLATAATAAGFVAAIAADFLTLPDWTLAAGVATLTLGARYWLSLITGRLTTTPPSAVGQAVIFLGVATAVDTLALNISQPTLL